MIITCPECDTKYRYDERRFGGTAVKQVKCTSCGFSFEVANPVVEAIKKSSPVAEQSRSMAAVAAPAGSAGHDQRETPTPRPEASPPVLDAADEPPLPPLPKDPRYSLAVIAGGQAGSVFQLHKPRVLIGRGSAMDIQLRDSEVSRRHALLEIRDPVVTLTDLGTTNGTWFNGTKITQTRLDHQDEFTVGSTTLMLIVTPVQSSA